MPVLKSDAIVRERIQYVDEAASGFSCIRIQRQMHEFPDRFGLKGRKRKSANNKMVVKWDMRAAKMGAGSAMNDIECSYATKFGGLP